VERWPQHVWSTLLRNWAPGVYAALMRSYEPADAETVLSINAENVPAVGPMDADKLAYFVENASFFVVVEDDDDTPVAFLVGLDETTVGYESPNYAYFAGRHDEFGYVDRVAVTSSSQGQGLGPAMYSAFEAWAYGHGKRVLAAEVNTIPDNPHSHHFHQKSGFIEVGRGNPYDPDEEVAYYEKQIDD